MNKSLEVEEEGPVPRSQRVNGLREPLKRKWKSEGREQGRCWGGRHLGEPLCVWHHSLQRAIHPFRSSASSKGRQDGQPCL